MDTPSARAAAVSYIASEVLRYGLVFLHQHANDAQIVEAVTDLLENVPRLIFDPMNPAARHAARPSRISTAFQRGSLCSKCILRASRAAIPAA